MDACMHAWVYQLTKPTHLYIIIPAHKHDREVVGKIVIECADEILPMTARNFALLCSNKARRTDGSACIVLYDRFQGPDTRCVYTVSV